MWARPDLDYFICLDLILLEQKGRIAYNDENDKIREAWFLLKIRYTPSILKLKTLLDSKKISKRKMFELLSLGMVHHLSIHHLPGALDFFVYAKCYRVLSGKE